MYRIPSGASITAGIGLLSVASLLLVSTPAQSYAQTASTSNSTSSTSSSTSPDANASATATTTTAPSTTPGTSPNTGITPVPGTGISNSPTYGNPAPGGINTTPGYSTNVTPGFAGNNSLPGYGLNNTNGVTTNTLSSTTYAPINAYNQNYGMPDFDNFGGPAYTGQPDVDLNSSFIGAGGGPYNFDIKEALGRMGGHVWAENEMLNLQSQFGAQAVQEWRDTFQFAVLDSYLIAKKNGINISWEPTYTGALLGERVVEAGQNGDHNFNSNFFMDKTVSGDIHHQVMRDIWVMNGRLSLRDFHRITNQAMTDLAHQLGFWDVHPGDVASDTTYDNSSPQPLAPALSQPGTAPLQTPAGTTPNAAQ